MANYPSYTMFYPLYPIGIGAEWWLLYQAIAPGAKISPDTDRVERIEHGVAGVISHVWSSF